MPETIASTLASRVPRLVALLGAAEVEARWDGLRAVYLWQVERDLELLSRHVPWPRVAAAYGDSLRNPDEMWGVVHELRTAVKLAPVVEGIELRPRIDTGACDLAVRLSGRKIFAEVTTRDDPYPWRCGGSVDDPPMQARETVHREFRTTTPDRVVPTTRDVPGSAELRQVISQKPRQLPRDGLGLVVLGTVGNHYVDVEDALFGDAQLRNDRDHRVPNGLFSVTDDDGGVSGLSAVVWLRLRHHWHDLRTYGRLFPNPKARNPLPPMIEGVFRRAFDPAAVLREELERIKRALIEQYRAERIILFGSLATDFPAWTVHDASDIDIAVIKGTTARFVDRVRDAMDLVEPRVGLNLFVYSPEEIARARASGPSFIRDEILAKGKTLFPVDG